MANGFMPYLLLLAKEAFKESYPGMKVTPLGYIRMLLSNTLPNIVSTGTDDGSGHLRDVKITYRQRLPQGSTKNLDNCEIDYMPVRKEASIPYTKFAKIGFIIEDDTVAHYEKEASQQAIVVNGIPTGLSQITPFFKEQWDIIMSYANALFNDMNTALLTTQVANFGVNQASGSSAARTINFPLDATLNNLNSGMSGLISDLRTNEINIANAAIVGNGLIDNYYMQQPAKTAAQNGLNTAAQARPELFTDYGTVNSWGANQFGVFEKNSVQFININRYVGNRAGAKPTSWFGTIPIPVVDAFGNVVTINFDVQLKYIDCKEAAAVGAQYVSEVKPGWLVILSKPYDQFNIPADAYAATDRLYQNNGTLRYNATNN